jgi:hypothetical protein
LTAFTMPRHRPADIASCFLTYSFFPGWGLLAPTPNPQHGRSGLRLYAPGHWVAWVPRDRHFRYPLTWAPEGLQDLELICMRLDANC